MLNENLRNFFTRAVSALLFVPLIIAPIIIKGYLLFFVFTLFLTLMIIEILDMIKIAKKKSLIYVYLLICIFTTFIFVLYISTNENITSLIIEIIITIWLFDTFCYLGGKIINGKKLIPKISKGKTFAGLYVGTFVTLLITALYFLQVYGNFNKLFYLVIPLNSNPEEL